VEAAQLLHAFQTEHIRQVLATCDANLLRMARLLLALLSHTAAQVGKHAA